MHIVTAGQPYIDIDAYAGIVSYAELLRLQGNDSLAYSASALNESITPTIRSWQAPVLTEYTAKPSDTFILIDISHPQQFDAIVDTARVETVIDHHVGFEAYWHERLGDKAAIEFVGSVCTLLYEYWRDAQLLDQISELSARLMVCAILDNTLHFKAHLTTPRDLHAYESLLQLAHLPADWPARYFSECQQTIMSNLERAIKNDTKVVDTPIIPHYPSCFGQLVVWDAAEILEKYIPKIRQALSSVKPDWAMNLVSINEGRSYIIADDQQIQATLGRLLGVAFDGVVAHAERLWLRKEMVKQAHKELNV